MCGLDWIGLHQKGVVPHFNRKIKETESSNYYVSFIKPDELFNMFEKVQNYLSFKWILNGLVSRQKNFDASNILKYFSTSRGD